MIVLYVISIPLSIIVLLFIEWVADPKYCFVEKVMSAYTAYRESNHEEKDYAIQIKIDGKVQPCRAIAGCEWAEEECMNGRLSECLEYKQKISRSRERRWNLSRRSILKRIKDRRMAGISSADSK